MSIFYFWKALPEWIKEGKANGATHLVVVCDTFDGDQYPVYVNPNPQKIGEYATLAEITSKYAFKNMQDVQEIIDLDHPEKIYEKYEKYGMEYQI